MKILDITKKGLTALAFAAVSLTSCVNDLDVTPIDPDILTPDKVYTSEEAFEEVLFKIYAGFAVSGQDGPDGNGDLGGFDEGHSQYWRAFFVNQEFPTDEVVNGWNDGNLPKLSQLNWGANNEYIKQFYYRAIYQVSVVNEFLRTSKDYIEPSYTEVDRYYAEARYLRALSYWHALDLYGNGVPFVTENTAIGSESPEPAGAYQGSELFDYIESELLAITGESTETNQVLIDAASGWGGQADKGSAWMLLAKLYLNNEAYLGRNNAKAAEYYTKAQTFVNKIINSNAYSLHTVNNHGDEYSAFEALFLADNHYCTDEIIFSINYYGGTNEDLETGNYNRTWGGSTYVINAAIGGEMTPSDYGTNSGWGGNRVLRELVNKFTGSDDRALFFSEGQSLDIEDQIMFTQGYAATKFKNVKQDGTPGSAADAGFADVNVPVFRLADVYLMAAELDLRINGSVSSNNAELVNQVRSRANASDVSSNNMNLDFILDERARELYWEGHRRTDLVRFDKFTSGDYVWQFKGGNVDGTGVADHYNVMPIPYDDIIANPKLVQNPNY